MKPTIQDLHESGQYRLVESFKIDEMTQFLARELGMAPAQKPGVDQSAPKTTSQNLKKWGHVALLLVLGAGVGWLIGNTLIKLVRATGTGTLAGGSTQFLIGLLAFIPLISLHEFIHGIFFKRVGAPRVGYGWSWKGMMAYAYAQNYVMNLRELAYVAVMPFLFITTALIAAWFIWPQFAIAWGTLLFIHTLGCMGDFVLINFWRKNQHRTMFTYDDVEVESRTYFFERVG